MPLSPADTRALLDSLGHRPDRKLGQNFLVDGNIVRKSLELAAIAAGDRVAEIGPGLGTLTRALLDAGARVWAVERDPALARHLRDALADAERFRLLEGDAIDHPLAGLPAQEAAGSKVVANLPYAIATPWMDAVLSGPLPERMVLMLQKEAADRYVAAAGGKAFGAISIFIDGAYSVAGRHRVSPSCFLPPPKVDSVLLRLDRKPDPFVPDPVVKGWIRDIFTRRRKQLGAVCRAHPHPGPARWHASLVASGVEASVRAEDLPAERWRELQQFL